MEKNSEVVIEKGVNSLLENNQEKRQQTAIIIGGGLVGALCAAILASRKYKVILYEKRPDIRKTKILKGRSINLALSHRGRKALKRINLEMEILKNATAMKGRLLHQENGKTNEVLYDPVNKQCIFSVSRNYLNSALLNAAEKYPDVTLNFNHKLIKVDLQGNLLEILNLIEQKITVETADLIIGADGAFSCLRSHLQKIPMFDFAQSYITHGYLELTIPIERGKNLCTNYLHIWPRGNFMMIALPNLNGSWTVTLFMPFEKFDALKDMENLLKFFENTFPDALPLIGQDELVEMFFAHQPSALVEIKCGRYHMGDRFLIIGDAAHAMVPFYGQGMNAGFEDCTLLDSILEELDDNISESIKRFTEKRKNDAHAICDLAMYNYKEMRDLVVRPSYKIRKFVDSILEKIMPEYWIPLYNSVSFSHMAYGQCVKNRKWQNQILSISVLSLGILLLALLLAFFQI